MSDEIRAKMDHAEAFAAGEFRSHPAIRGPLVIEQIQRVTQERRHLSLIFTQIYDMLLDGIDQLKAKNIVREIIREEYPRTGVNEGRSHREDLVIDMMMTGLTREAIIAHRPSSHTSAVIRETEGHVLDLLARPQRSLLAISFIRMWGEVLTAIEYEALWYAGLQDCFGRKEDSIFYWSHFEHDRARRGFVRNFAEEPRGSMTHADQLTRCLRDMVNSESDAEEIMQVNHSAYDLKSRFYDQFS